MLIGSVSSIVFNGNPLLKFDSYFMLSDYLEIPNLYERSRKQSYYLFEKYIFRIKEGLQSSSDSMLEGFWLVLYGFLSSIYRVIVSLSIVLFLADQWFLLGSIMAMVAIYTWLLKPLYSFFTYLFTDQKLRLNRLRAITISFGFIGFILISLTSIPFYKSIRAYGIVESSNYSTIYTPTEGLLKETFIKNGEYIKKGDKVALLENHDLTLQLVKYQSQLVEIQALIIQAISSRIADLKPIRKKEETILKQIQTIQKKQLSLIILARQSGVFISSDIKILKNTWLKTRHHLGQIIDLYEYEFKAVVSQNNSFDLFKSTNFKSQVKMYGMASETIESKNLTIIPYEQDILPSASLGWKAGGEIATKDDDSSGTRTKESFFLVTAKLNPSKVLHHGKRGELRIELKPESIAKQFYKGLKQVIQRRYGL